MFVVPTNHQHHHHQPFVSNHAAAASTPATQHKLSALLSRAASTASTTAPSPMERSAPEYSQTGLPSPYPSNFGDTQSEGSSADSSAAQYPVKQDVAYPASATPTSEYGVYPPSSRSTTFPEHLQQRHYHNPAAASSHASNNSSGDPSIAAPSPTYGGYTPHSPYAHGHYPPDSAGIYQPRDWTGGYNQPLTPVFAQPGSRGPNQHQVYSFVPIPGAQQHKRPRRRYEEIERMYKCGWNGCEKAYGTLNHLNAHVTMQSHGQKRTPEEFKEIRKEWKARKKAEDEARNRERQQAEAGAAPHGSDGPGDDRQPGSYSVSQSVTLPPIGGSLAGYPSPQYQAPNSAGMSEGSVPGYSTSPMYSNYPPAGAQYHHQRWTASQPVGHNQVPHHRGGQQL